MLEGSYRGYTVRSNPPPGSGATLIQMLQIPEHFELGRLDHSSARHLDLVARAMAAAHVDRNEYLGDPRFADVPTAMLISKERAAYWAEKMQAWRVPRRRAGRRRPRAPRTSAPWTATATR